MSPIAKVILLLNAERHHNYKRRKDPSLAAVVAGGGYVVANGVLSTVYLPLVDNSTAVYTVWIETVHRFLPAPSLPLAKAAAAQSAASPGDQAKHHINALLDIAGDIENRIVRAIEPNNVVNFAEVHVA